MDIEHLVHYEKSTITNLGFRLDKDFRLNRQISSMQVEKYSFQGSL